MFKVGEKYQRQWPIKGSARPIFLCVAASGNKAIVRWPNGATGFEVWGQYIQHIPNEIKQNEGEDQ